MNSGTKLYYLSANNPDELTQFVRALDFKVEIKEIFSNKSKFFLFFTSDDANAFMFQGDIKKLKKEIGKPENVGQNPSV